MNFTICDKRKALLDQEGHLLALGGPGSGKTTIALLKAQRVMSGCHSGQEVLFLSFSRAAVHQILHRCRTILTSDERRRIRVQTYHSFCMDLLIAHSRLMCGKPARILFPGEERLREAEFGKAWNAELRRLAVEDGVYCFKMFAARVADLVEQSAAVRALIADRYPLIVVDEFQDTDDDQWRIVRALADETTVFCLADPDQRIFEYQDTVDPERVEKMRKALQPRVFDFANENNRSPYAGGILAYADAVLRNRGPLPESDDVALKLYRSWQFDTVVHAAVLNAFAELRTRNIESPSVAVLARTNPMIARISAALSEPRELGAAILPAIDHEVVWDAELSVAAAVVVATVLSWPEKPAQSAIYSTLVAAVRFFRLKGAGSRGATARAIAARLQAAAEQVFNDQRPRIAAARDLLLLHEAGIEFAGQPVSDWLKARSLLKGLGALDGVFKESRLVRLFRAGDALAAALASLWLETGAYEGAPEIVKRVLEREQLLGAATDPSGCVLMNMHKSKGKEFDAVVIVEGERQGLFLSDREPPPQLPSRRLLRVGITRAKRHVTLVRSRDAEPLV